MPARGRFVRLVAFKPQKRMRRVDDHVAVRSFRLPYYCVQCCERYVPERGAESSNMWSGRIQADKSGRKPQNNIIRSITSRIIASPTLCAGQWPAGSGKVVHANAGCLRKHYRMNQPWLQQIRLAVVVSWVGMRQPAWPACASSAELAAVERKDGGG